MVNATCPILWPLTTSCLNGECLDGVCVCPDGWSGENNALNMPGLVCTYSESALWGFRIANLFADFLLSLLLFSKMNPYIRGMYGHSSKMKSQVSPTPPASHTSNDESASSGGEADGSRSPPKAHHGSNPSAHSSAGPSGAPRTQGGGGKTPWQRMMKSMTFLCFCGTILNQMVRVLMIIADTTTRKHISSLSSGAYVFIWGSTFSLWWEIFFITLYNIFKTAFCSINNIKMHDLMVLPPEIANAQRIKRVGNFGVIFCFAAFTYLAAVPSTPFIVKHGLWAVGFVFCSFFCIICSALVLYSSKAIIRCLDSMIAQVKNAEEQAKLQHTRKGWWLFRWGLGFILSPLMGVILLLPMMPVVTLHFAGYLVYLCCTAATFGSLLVTFVQKLRVEDSHE